MSWLSDFRNRLRDRKKPPAPPVDRPVPPVPVDATAAERAILEAGRTYRHTHPVTGAAVVGVRSIVDGQMHEAVLREARAYAAHMASINRQDAHADFSERSARIRAAISGARVSEISAESWEGQALEAAATDVFVSWEQSRGHWATANGPARFIGYSMARGKSRWYACGLVVS